MILIGLLFLMASKTSFAQLPQTIEFGPHAGITTYQGDINPWKFFNEFGYSVGGLVRFTYDTRWAFRADYSYGVIHASDPKAGWRPERDLAFKTKLHDAALIAEFNFLDYYTGRRESGISPYLFAGISGFQFNSGVYIQDSLQWDQFTGGIGVNPDLNLDTTVRAYKKQFESVAGSALASGWSFSIPFGFGCKFSLTDHLAASVEWRMHYTFTDDLDGIVRTEDGANRSSLYPADDMHQFFTRKWTQVMKYKEDGNPLADADGNPTLFDHFDYNVVTGNPADIAAEGYDYYYRFRVVVWWRSII